MNTQKLSSKFLAKPALSSAANFMDHNVTGASSNVKPSNQFGSHENEPESGYHSQARANSLNAMSDDAFFASLLTGIDYYFPQLYDPLQSLATVNSVLARAPSICGDCGIPQCEEPTGKESMESDQFSNASILNSLGIGSGGMALMDSFTHGNSIGPGTSTTQSTSVSLPSIPPSNNSFASAFNSTDHNSMIHEHFQHHHPLISELVTGVRHHHDTGPSSSHSDNKVDHDCTTFTRCVNIPCSSELCPGPEKLKNPIYIPSACVFEEMDQTQQVTLDSEDDRLCVTCPEPHVLPESSVGSSSPCRSAGSSPGQSSIAGPSSSVPTPSLRDSQRSGNSQNQSQEMLLSEAELSLLEGNKATKSNPSSIVGSSFAGPTNAIDNSSQNTAAKVRFNDKSFIASSTTEARAPNVSQGLPTKPPPTVPKPGSDTNPNQSHVTNHQLAGHHHHHVHVLHHHHSGANPTFPSQPDNNNIKVTSGQGSDSKLRKRGRPPKPVVAEAIIARREMHSAYQRRRRDSIAEGFRALALRIPLVTACSSREVILRAASEYIDALKAGNGSSTSLARDGIKEGNDLQGDEADYREDSMEVEESYDEKDMDSGPIEKKLENQPESNEFVAQGLDPTSLSRRLAFAVDLIGTLRTRARVLEVELAQTRVELAHARAEVVEARLGQLQGRI